MKARGVLLVIGIFVLMVAFAVGSAFFRSNQKPLSQAGEFIERFDARYIVRPDASLSVQESITYNFGEHARHGIIREIPFRYPVTGGSHKLKIDGVQVTDHLGGPEPFSVSRSGDNFVIKIGDPNRFVTGLHTYRIQYDVLRPFNYFPDHDELYWNVTGQDWGVPITHASARIFLPERIFPEQLRLRCYAAYFGSREKCQTAQIDPLVTAQGMSVNFEHTHLARFEGLTVVIGFPKGVIYEPSQVEFIFRWIADRWVLLLPILTLIGLFIAWHRQGRNPRAKGPVIPHYESPEGLSPLEVAAVTHERVRNRDLSAELIFLATQGYLKITRVEENSLGKKGTDYILQELKSGEDLPNRFQRELLERIFHGRYVKQTGPEQIEGIYLSKLQGSFLEQAEKIKDLAYHHVVDRGYLPGHPENIRFHYLVAAISLFAPVLIALFYQIGFRASLHIFIWLSVFGLISIWQLKAKRLKKNHLFFALPLFVFGAVVFYFAAGWGAFSLLLCAILIFVWGRVMPTLTAEGARIKLQIKGLKWYLRVAEKKRISFHDAPALTPQLFDRLLPYAMILGVDDKWIKRFTSIYQAYPAWYAESGTMQSFQFSAFSSHMRSFARSSTFSFSTHQSVGSAAGYGRSGFGGGGFSGGGFGGGGGRSW